MVLVSEQEIKFVIVGFGHIGKRHAIIADQYPGARVVAIVDINTDVRNHELFPKEAQFFESIDAFIQSGIGADIATIATPNGLHCTHAVMALEAGFNVIIEKPMGLNKAECERVIDSAITADKQVFVVKQNRYSPPAKWMKEIVGAGKIGKVCMVQVNCYWNRDERYYNQQNPSVHTLDSARLKWKGTLKYDGGILFTQFSHFIDMMYWVFGDLKNIRATLANFNHTGLTEFEDSGIAQFEFISGGIGSINFSTAVWDKNMESSFTVVGSKGSFKIGGQYMNKVEYCHIENYIMPTLEETNPPNDYGAFTGSAANHFYVIENAVNTLKGTDTITANAIEGMKVVDIIERIYSAANTNRVN